MIPAPLPPRQLKALVSGKAPQTEFELSPTQYDRFLACERAAGLEYIDGYRSPENPHSAAACGDRIHDILERFVKFGERPNLQETFEVRGEYNGRPWSRTVYVGQVADVAICLIPPNAVAETPLRFTRPNGITWVGRRDLRIPGVPTAEVRDYKSTSDFKWMDEKNLDTDTQATVYATAECEEHPETKVVHLHWQFLRTKGKPDSKSLRLDVTRERAYERMAQLDDGAARWIELRRKGARGEIRGGDLEPTGLKKGTCDKFDGCPHRGKGCILSTEQLLNSTLGDRSMDVSAVLAGFTQKQQAVATIPAPAGFVPAPAAPTVAVQQTRPSFWIPGDPMNPAQEYFKGQGKPLSMIASAADAPPPAEVCASYDLPGVVTQPDPINAPEKPMIAAVNPATHAALSPVPAPVAEIEATDGERDALKAEAVRLNLVTSSSRLGAKALKDLISRAQSTPVPAPAVNPFAQHTVPVKHEAVIPVPEPMSAAPLNIPAPTGAILESPAADAVLEAKIDAFFAALRPLLVAACK
jgi:hypothetical protein